MKWGYNMLVHPFTNCRELPSKPTFAIDDLAGFQAKSVQSVISISNPTCIPKYIGYIQINE